MKPLGKDQYASLRHIPAALSPRCRRDACLGAICPSWRHCGPGTAMSGYRALLQATPVRVETAAKARRIFA